MASETTFDHWKVFFSWGKVRKRALTQNSLVARFSIFFVVTREVICQKMAPILNPFNFFGVFSLISHCVSIALRAWVDDQYFYFWHITHHQHAVFCIYDDVIIMAILILAVASAIRLSWQRKSAKTEPANAIGYTWYLSNIIYFIFVTSPSKIKQWISLVVSLNIHQEFVQGFCKIVWIKIYLCDRKYIKWWDNHTPLSKSKK